MSLQELNLNSTELFEELDERQAEVLMGGGVVYEIEVKDFNAGMPPTRKKDGIVLAGPGEGVLTHPY